MPSTALLLPFDGFEFVTLAAAVLLLSVFWLADGMRGGEIRGCPVDLWFKDHGVRAGT